jgi:hypothetical protein
MIINDKKYILTENNFIPIETMKSQIVLANTLNTDMCHFKGWTKRYNGKYLKTAAFTIDAAGLVYKHFDPKYHSKYFGELEHDTKSIVILLENNGWLTKNTEKNEFNNWLGGIYNKDKKIFKKKWRGYEYWACYNDKQVESAVNLVKILCEEYFIPLSVMTHNTKVDVDALESIVYKSNINKHYKDLNPSWDCLKFKNKIENERKH